MTTVARLLIAWDGANYVDESAYLAAASGNVRLAAPNEGIGSGRGQVDRCQIDLFNENARFSPFNASSPIYSLIQDGKGYHAPFRFDISRDGTNYYRVFTGVLKIPGATSTTPTTAGLARFDGRSCDELLLQKRLSTALGNFQTYHDGGYNEAQLIDAWLTQAGVSSKTIMPGMVQIPWAWLDDESCLEECWALAAACGGVVYCDVDGVMRYDNAVAWATNSASKTSQETIDRAALQNLEILYDDGELYDTVTAEYSSRYVDAPGVLWEPDEIVRLAPGATKKLTARFKQAAYVVDVPNFRARTAGGTDITSSVSITMTAYAQRAELTIVNSHATAEAYLVQFSLTGRGLVGGPTGEETRTSAEHGYNAAFFAARGSRTLSIRSNNYCQGQAQAGMLALLKLHRVERPRITYKIKTGANGANPQRRVGWRVTISDSKLLSSNRDAIITGIDFRLSPTGGFTQDLEAVDASQLFVDASYFVIGTNTLGAASLPIYY